MRARNVTAGEDHDHERRADGKRRDYTRTRANSRATDR